MTPGACNVIFTGTDGKPHRCSLAMRHLGSHGAQSHDLSKPIVYERSRLVASRHGDPKRDDHWMLEHWSTPNSHRVRLMQRSYRDAGGVVVTDYRTECTCGWVSEDSVFNTVVQCEVGLALGERSQRSAADKKRSIKWETANGD